MREVLTINQINFNFGIFEYNEITINSIPLIKGKFSLNMVPNFTREFERPFLFYDLAKNLKNDDVISLGPYYPWGNLILI